MGDQRELKRDLDAAGRAVEEEARRAERLKRVQDAAANRPALPSVLGNVAGTAAASAATRKSLQTAGDLEHGLAEFGNVTGATAEKIAEVRRLLLSTAGAVNQTATELLAGLQILTGKGLDFDRSVASIAVIGKMATATRASVEDLSTTAFSLIDNLKVSPDELPKAMEMLAQAANQGGFEVKDMARHFPQLTASAQALGIKGTAGVAALASSLQVARKGGRDHLGLGWRARVFHRPLG